MILIGLLFVFKPLNHSGQFYKYKNLNTYVAVRLLTFILKTN